MRRWRRVILVAWFCLCTVVAFNLASLMGVTVAPRHTASDAARRVELESIEHVRRYWMGDVFASSGLLVLTAAALVAIGWRRGRSVSSDTGPPVGETPAA